MPMYAHAAPSETDALTVIERDLARLLELVRSTISERETP